MAYVVQKKDIFNHWVDVFVAQKFASANHYKESMEATDKIVIRIIKR